MLFLSTRHVKSLQATQSTNSNKGISRTERYPSFIHNWLHIGSFRCGLSSTSEIPPQCSKSTHRQINQRSSWVKSSITFCWQPSTVHCQQPAALTRSHLRPACCTLLLQASGHQNCLCSTRTDTTSSLIIEQIVGLYPTWWPPSKYRWRPLLNAVEEIGKMLLWCNLELKKTACRSQKLQGWRTRNETWQLWLERDVV